MWHGTGQQRFRSGVDSAIRACLRLIGYPGEARVDFVRVPDPGALDADRARMETFGLLNPTDIWARAARIAKELAGRHAAEDDYCISSAAEAGLASHPADAGWSFFVSPRSASADGQRTFVAVALRDADLTSVPRLRTAVDDDPLPSLVHAVVRHVLYRAGLLLASDPNHPDILVLSRQAHELVRTATANLVARAFLADSSHADHHLLLNSISALPYEGRAGNCTVVAVSPDCGLARINLRLRSPIPIKNIRSVRKLMECTTQDTSLLLHDGSIHGIGSLIPAEREALESRPLAFRIMGRGTWQLEQGHRVLMQVRDGLSRLPSAGLDMAVDDAGLRERIAWLLPGADVEALTRLAQSLEGSAHGAMLIISGRAEREAVRFGAQACGVEPVPLMPEVAAALAEMDGGILVDEQGRCHAIGVLLDGQTGSREEFARGSRYNNAARYLALDGDPQASPGSTRTIVIVYSADGMVDILPPLYPSRHAALLKRILDDFTDAVRAPTQDVQEIARALASVNRHRFYLSEPQCTELNESLDAAEPWPAGMPRPCRFTPDPRMDPGRFIR